MPKRSRTFCLIILLTLVHGCERSSSTPMPSKPASPQTADLATDPDFAPPQHTPVQVFINNHKFGETNGCTSTFTPQSKASGTHIKWGSTCGHPGAVSKVSWSYLRSDENGDHYRFERIFPFEEPKQKSTSKEIIYTGAELVLFEDDTQRVVMRPPPTND